MVYAGSNFLIQAGMPDMPRDKINITVTECCIELSHTPQKTTMSARYALEIFQKFGRQTKNVEKVIFAGVYRNHVGDTYLFGLSILTKEVPS